MGQASDIAGFAGLADFLAGDVTGGDGALGLIGRSTGRIQPDGLV